ncbi:MAG: PQQ-dependent sugar dehydrogenase [Cyclobacteriaceae bacterium]
MRNTSSITFCLILSLFLYYCSSPQQENTPVMEASAHEPVDSATLQAEKLYKEFCSSCHGEQMMAFADRKWKHGKERDSIRNSIVNGYVDAGMPTWGASFTDEQIDNLVDYILKGIENVERYGFKEITLESDTFKTEDLQFELDTIASGLKSPWGMAFLPDGDVLITDKSGKMYRVDAEGNKNEISGVPTVRYERQGGLFEVELHPDFATNKWLYLSYADIKIDNGDTLTGTAVSRYKFDNDRLSSGEKVLEGHPYSEKRHHYGGRLAFDNDGFLFVSIGDRGKRDENPQSLSSYCGKIHRINDDGSIPSDNPFVGVDTAAASVYSYGHRNPQGMVLNTATNRIWTNEHGPRGGDEVNLIQKGKNFGWPVISYGLNYDGTTFTNKLEQEGMVQPDLYWVPSIAPSGMAIVNSDRYGAWSGDMLVGSLRFKYLNRCVMEGDKIVREEILMKNIGRLRNVSVSPDGYIYVAVESPGYVFRLMPF